MKKDSLKFKYIIRTHWKNGQVVAFEEENQDVTATGVNVMEAMGNLFIALGNGYLDGDYDYNTDSMPVIYDFENKYKFNKIEIL